MPIVIGQKPDHDFTQPVGLLGDCHRRVERFLGVLVNLGSNAGAVLDAGRRSALQGALHYFRDAAPRHTADEEVSLFPRLRAMHAAEVRDSLAIVDRLEADHQYVAPLHAELDDLGRRWLLQGTLHPEPAARFRQLAEGLAAAYQEHIRLEDSLIFPLAGRHLAPAALEAIGAEMAARRGVAGRR
jgi:hemerythrin-like domain-containing protein